MSPFGDTPANEAQARELAPLKGDAQAIVEVWADLSKQWGDEVTATKVREAVTETLLREEKTRCGHCHRHVRLRGSHKCPAAPEIDKPEITEYSIDSERRRQIAEKAAERFWKVVSNRSPNGGEPVHELIHLDRALAILTDEEVADAIEQLEQGIVETKAMLVQLRRHRGPS